MLSTESRLTENMPLLIRRGKEIEQNRLDSFLKYTIIGLHLFINLPAVVVGLIWLPADRMAGGPVTPPGAATAAAACPPDELVK